MTHRVKTGQDDMIQSKILPQGGLLIFGGPPNVGKTDLLFSWLTHMAAGVPFLNIPPPRPLKIFFLQDEIEYHYLRERVQKMNFDQDALELIGKNLHVTPQIRVLMNGKGVETVRDAILEHFDPYQLDIIAIDPPRNFYDIDDENDNTGILFFLQDRIERLRALINPNIGIIITHLTPKNIKKISELKGYPNFN